MEDVLNTKQLNIVDDRGQIRATIGMKHMSTDHPEPCITIYDRDGFARMEVGLSEDSPVVALLSRSGNPSLGIGTRSEFSKGFFVSTDDGHPAVDIEVNPKGAVMIRVYKDGNPHVIYDTDCETE